jgi:hypothetical protein
MRSTLGCRLSCFGLLRRSNRRARIGDFRFKCANRLAEQGDRSRFALGKISLCFLSHPLVVTSPAADRAQDGALQRCTCDKRTDVEPRGKVKAKVRRRAIPECRRQSLLNARFERHDFGDANSPPHFLGIKILEALDAYLKSLDTIALLFQRERRSRGPWRRSSTMGHAVHSACADHRLPPRNSRRMFETTLSIRLARDSRR